MWQIRDVSQVCPTPEPKPWPTVFPNCLIIRMTSGDQLKHSFPGSHGGGEGDDKIF